MKYFTYIFLFLLPILGFSQNNLEAADDYDRISLQVFIPDQVERIPDGARSLLINKLTQATTQSGLAGGGPDQRFLLTANMDILSKDVVPGAPNRFAYLFEVSLFVVDFIDQNIVSSTSFEVRGAGSTENRAFTVAVRSLKPNHPKIEQFLDEGKQKIVSYYNARCDFIIARARSQAAQRQYEDALNTLVGVPEVSKDCYIKTLDEVGPIFKDFANFNCHRLMSIASSSWAASPNSNGAQRAGAVLSQMDPGSDCYAESLQLISKMEEKVLKDEGRDWKFIEKVFENEVMLESLRIRAWRDVGVAFGKGQQPTYNDIVWIFR